MPPLMAFKCGLKLADAVRIVAIIVVESMYDPPLLADNARFVCLGECECEWVATSRHALLFCLLSCSISML